VAILAAGTNPEEGAELADKVLRIDPNADAGTLNTIKDAYFFAKRFEKLIAVRDEANQGWPAIPCLQLRLSGTQSRC
jgi:hypothetical protein